MDSLLAHLCRFTVRVLNNILEAFLGSMASPYYPSHFTVIVRGFAYVHDFVLEQTIPPVCWTLPSPSLHQLLSSSGISTWCPSATPVGLALGPDLPREDEPYPWKPWAFDGWDSHPSYRYSHRHSHCSALQLSFRSTFNALSTLPYRLDIKSNPAVSVLCLAPIHFRRRITRLVSYYALFKGWLLLSQPPSCLCDSTSFPT